MSIFDWATIITFLVMMIGWPSLFFRPAYLAIRNTWDSRKTNPLFFVLSTLYTLGLAMVTIWFYYLEFFATNPPDTSTPGMVLILVWLGIPLAIFPESLFLYILLKFFAKRQHAWRIDLVDAVSKNTSMAG